ncbi:intercellular adhesion molecule 5-like [Pristis pectinata]|uniref:intercellular adhesion molecule 5-like n=1 Tax=Pristis pectinata TaxID=685728 RepID=UPI00223E6678|nr:intercellular adhesion molecule 5-like [Pristis pectinata]XP_051897873.1 intercellular adhesion molecule 5-like [Pristis pectinata]XP_051897874.1 intercellular adhesion molecule 5-like [Pristis pectinata]
MGFHSALCGKCQSANRTNDKRAVVTVYNRELNVSQPPELLEFNKSYQLECTGPRVYPKNNLILTWLRGSEVVQNNSTGEAGFPDADDRLRNVLNFIANTSDDGQMYTCSAEVDLGSNKTKLITNSSVTLKTYSFPEPPRILSRDPVEVNQEVTLTCEVPNVYPAEKMRVRWLQNGEELKSVTNTPDPTTVQATTAWTPRETGWTELICTAEFEDYPSVPSKNNSIFIEVYVLPEPKILIPNSYTGIRVNITCSVFNVSGELQLRLKKGSEILVNRLASTGLTIFHTVNPQAELNGQQYTCETELTLQQHFKHIVKRQNATLNVQGSTDEKWIYGFIIAILAILAIVVIIYIKHRVHKIGQYKVLNARANKNQEIPCGKEHQNNIPLETVKLEYSNLQTGSTNSNGIKNC